ncbi:hypothetical protein J7S27_02750 [Carnobacteriaceae bacterium zg-C25]|nr:hypothetical protein J7S27_02750 [Carnobacteriaceae bacterium zg-C25]
MPKMILSIWIIFLSVYIPLVNALDYISSFFYTLLILYVIYVVSTLLHLFINVRKLNCKYIVVYPFTFHKKLECHPIRLLYYPEMVRDTIPVNLIYQLKTVNSETILYQQLNKLRLSRELSRYVATCLILYSINSYVFTIPLWSCGVMCIALFVQSYFGNHTIWIGNSAVIHYKKYFELVLSKHYISDVDVNVFRVFLANNYKRINTTILLKIMLNYCVALKNNPIKESDEQLIQEIVDELSETIYRHGVENFMLFNYVIFSIGFLGVEKSEKLIATSKQGVYSLKSDLSELNHSGIFSRQNTKMDKFLTFLNTKNKNDLKMSDYIFNFPKIFNA